jgi:four helix bundle protein
MSIASKEARESLYWLRLTPGKALPLSEVNPAIEHIEKIIRILTSIVKSSND